MSKKVKIKLIVFGVLLGLVLMLIMEIRPVDRYYSGAGSVVCDDCGTDRDYGFPLIYKTRSSGGWTWGVTEYNIYYQILDSILVLILSQLLVFITYKFYVQIKNRKIVKK